jgi:hypothetical protein
MKDCSFFFRISLSVFAMESFVHSTWMLFSKVKRLFGNFSCIIMHSLLLKKMIGVVKKNPLIEWIVLVIVRFIHGKPVSLGGFISLSGLMFYSTIHFMIGSSFKMFQKETIFHCAKILILDSPLVMEVLESSCCY